MLTIPPHTQGATLTDFHVAGEVLKVDESLGLVMGYAIVCTDAGEPYFDKQGDHVPEDAMLKASCDFMQHSRVARDMHSGADQGTVVFAWPITTEVAKAFGQEAVKTDLGNGAEIDLFDALRAKFRSDAIKRIDKGVAGAAIWHEVVHEGDTCGRVIYDAKNRRAWRNSYVDKLRNDQLAANADHAVLATKAFGQGRQQLHTQNGVIVAHPARVVVIVAILRAGLIRARRLSLSREETTEKTAALYEFVNSERCSQLFEHFEEVTKELLEIDVAEKNAHEATWEQRGERIRKTERLILGILRAEMYQILQEGPGRE